MLFTSFHIPSISTTITRRASYTSSSRLFPPTTTIACPNDVIFPASYLLNPTLTSQFISSSLNLPRLRPSLPQVHFPGVQLATAKPPGLVQTTSSQVIPGDRAVMDAYHFPDGRLQKKMEDSSKTPLLLVACGSFSPITFLHLRMFMMAWDYVRFSTEFEIIGGYLSPVSDAYKKQGLSPAEHR